MVFVDSFGEFAGNFFPMLVGYLFLRLFMSLLESYGDLQKRYLKELSKHIDALDKMNILTYHNHLNSASAAFWKQCFGHLVDQIDPYAKDKEAVMERADLMLADYLGDFREHFKEQVVSGCEEKYSSKESLMRILTDMFPND